MSNSKIKPPKSLYDAIMEAVNEGKGKTIPKELLRKTINRWNKFYAPKPKPMPTSIRMNKINRGKIQKSLGKSVKKGTN